MARTVGTLSKWGWQCQRQESRKIFLCNPHVLLSIIFTLVKLYVSICTFTDWILLTQVFPPQTKRWMLISSWNVSHILKTTWKWNSWSLIWEQDSTNASFISDICMHFLSCVISLVLLMSGLSLRAGSQPKWPASYLFPAVYFCLILSLLLTKKLILIKKKRWNFLWCILFTVLSRSQCVF